MENIREQLAAINAISAVVCRSLDIQDVLDNAVSKITELTGFTVVLAFLLDSRGQDYELKAYRGASVDRVRTLQGLSTVKALNEQVARSGMPLVLGGVAGVTELPAVLAKEDLGTALVVPLNAKDKPVGTLWLATRGLRQFLDEEVAFLATIGVQIGIAIENARLYREEHLAKQEALASEKRYRELFEFASDAIWIHDLHGNIVAVNKAAEKLSGYKSEELLKMNVKSFLTDVSRNLAGQVRYKLLRGEPIEQPYEQRLTRKDGTEGIVNLTTSLITEDGNPTGFQHIARDVTAERATQENLSRAYQELKDYDQRLKESQAQLIQAEKLTSLGQLAASVAHEVNNPLSGVLVYTQLLAKKIAADNIAKEVTLGYLKKMETELTRSTRLIRNLLDFARQSTPSFREVDINEVIGRAFELASHSAQLQHIEVLKELDPNLPKLMADFDQLQQVCTNL
ncbi:MAG: PAS domain S-box protein, partial [Chloroflexota bacterium]|nr:PAS domain S-box protein [Chloroflexota bacterium]